MQENSVCFLFLSQENKKRCHDWKKDAVINLIENSRSRFYACVFTVAYMDKKISNCLYLKIKKN